MDLQLGAKINPTTGCTGRGRDLQAKCADKTACFYLVYQETQLCGHSPKDRVNHIYIVFLCD
jgi:hypothetical protein